MSAAEWGQLGAAAIAILSGLFIGLRWLVKGWLNELRPNSGSSLKDQVTRVEEQATRLEHRLDELFIMLSKK
jgi:hypothetical protein